MKNKKYIEFPFLILLGIITSSSLPPYNFVFINFIIFSLFFYFLYIKKKSFKRDNIFLFGWLFGFGYFLSNLYWITFSLEFDDNFEFLIPLALILIPSFLAIFYGIVTYCFFLINLKNALSNLMLFSLLIGLSEFLRGLVFTGFPWNLIAYSFSNNIEILQIISLIGTYAFNVICISFFSSLAIFFLKKNKKEILFCIILLLLPIIFYVYGFYKIKSFQLLEKIKNDRLIRVIGSEIEINRFFENTNTKTVIDELIQLSDPNPDTKTLFIWPEGIIPQINQSDLKDFEFLFNKRFNKNHLIVIGINHFDNISGKNKYYNSFSLYDHKLNVVSAYNKVNLVPFGEFLPFEKILSNFGLKSLTNNYQSYTKGDKREIITVKDDDFIIKILPLICYEIIYSGKIFDNDNFDYIVNISEDGWFGDSIGPYQHFTHSIFRAIESGKYVIRSANNGITAIISPVGSVEKKISLSNSGYIDFYEKRVSNSTLFSKQGNNMFLILILLYIFLMFSFNRIS